MIARAFLDLIKWFFIFFGYMLYYAFKGCLFIGTITALYIARMVQKRKQKRVTT